MPDELLRAEIDGRPVSAEQLWQLALHSFGHFTAMQVRDGRVRGLDLHLARLAAANRELFDVDVDPELVRAHIRHAVAGIAAASVRTMIQWPDGTDAPIVFVTVRPPHTAPATPHRLLSVPHQRELPHLKQVGGGFGQVYYRHVAQRRGYTEILLTGPDGVLAEGGVSNIGCYDGSALVWPDAPALSGITMQLLERHLPAAGIPCRRQVLRVADLAAFESVVVTNSRGLAPADRVNEEPVPVDEAFVRRVSAVYDSVPWDVI
jgi:branched-subunit amino acid aminotransferase/4-amino-4-deoxychorismate lyase